MFRSDAGHECLVDGAGAEGGEHGLAAGSEPTAGVGGIGLCGSSICGRKAADSIFTEPCIAVGECLDGVVVDDEFEKIGDAVVDAVAGELGGQREVESPFIALRPAAIGGGECGFGFPDAHRCLDDVEAGLICEGDESFLKRARGEWRFCGFRE